jgi:hypothetical protein
MIDMMETMMKPAGKERDTFPEAQERAPDAHGMLDDSLSSIIGNARMIALDAGGRGGDLAARLEAIIDNARKISLIVHQQFGSGDPAPSGRVSDNSRPGGRMNEGAGECPCWT